jgi:hypothetical protein
MVRISARSGYGAIALALVAAGCSGHSKRNVMQSNAEAGSGVDGERGGDLGGAGAGGRGGSTAAGAGGSQLEAGSGGQSEAGRGQGGASTAGRGGDAAGGAPEAGAGGDRGEGGDGAESVPGPGWIPTGVFGPALDDFVTAVREYTQAICRTGLGTGFDEDQVEQCVLVELHNFAPSLEWTACASRYGNEFASRLSTAAAEYRSCTAMVEASGSLVICAPSSVSRDFEGCPAWHAHPLVCASGDYFLRCDGVSECPDDYDERNCDPEASSYTCTDGAGVDWHVICDGTGDCSDGIDEFRCEM